MASYASTSSLLRHSVFDAAFEIGLADPKLAAWLEEEEPPSSPDSKPPQPPQQQQRAPSSFKPPPISTRTPSADRWAAVSPQSDSSASLSTIPSIPSASSQATSLSSFDASAPFAQKSRPFKTISPPPNSNDVFPQSHTVPPATFAVDIATAAPAVKPTKQSMKLLKKNRGGTSKKPEVARGDSTDVGTEERGRFAFLQREPSPPPGAQQDKDGSKSFFGRLRDRSRSKSKVRKNTIDSNSNSPQKTVEPPLPSNEDRGRSQDPKHVVTVVTSGGAPQLQLDAPSSRKSSDLLATFGDQFGTPLTLDLTSTSTMTSTSPPSRPIPRPGQRPVMDRSYARARTSGLWANKERGFPVSRGNGGGSRTGVARKGSAARKPSIRTGGAAGPRRVPSTRRRAGVRSRSTSVGSEAAFKQVMSDAEVAEIPDEDGFGSEHEGRAAASSSSGHGHYERPPIPKIVQHRPSNGSALSSLTLLQPIPPSPSPSPNGSAQTFLPRTPSPNRLSGTPTGIRRHSRNIPSPLQPPTSPLPPTPTELAPPRSRGGDSSHWYDDDDDSNRLGASRPVSPAGSYVVPTPTPGATTFHAEAARTTPAPVAAKYAPQRGSNERMLPPMKPLPPGVTGAVVRPRTPSDATRSGMTPAPSIENLKGAVTAPSAWPTTLRPTHSRRSAMSSHTSEDRTSPRPSLETDARPSLDIIDPTANHVRSNSASSNGQRGRMSPFPTRPISRSNSRATTPIPAGYDDYVPRMSEDSVRMGSDESVPGLSLRRKGSIAGPIKPGDREKLPTGRPYAALGTRAPSPSLSTSASMPKLAAYQNRAASPAAPPPTSMRTQPPLSVRPSSLQNRAASPGLRPTSTVNRQGSLPSRGSVYSKSAKLRENLARPDIKSVYSTGEWESEDDGDRFGFGFDDEDEEEGNGFDVIAKMIGSGPIAESSRQAPAQLNIPASTGGRGRGVGGRDGGNVLTVPILPLSPQPSPRMRTPVGAGGAKWI